MAMAPLHHEQAGRDPGSPSERGGLRWIAFVALAAVVGLAFMVHQAWTSSATYDEVVYLRIAAHWWRTGDQVEISRMGSPLTFWKLQQVPVFWLLDHFGHRAWVDEPIVNQSALLPLVRMGSLWVWVIALTFTAAWARELYGPAAMAYSAWLFMLSPNLLAHGALATMELPLLAATSGIFYVFWRYLRDGRDRDFLAAAVLSGLAFSCKFTAVLIPPMLGMLWGIDRGRSGARPGPTAARRCVARALAFLAVVLLTDCAVTGFATLPLSANLAGSHPSLDVRLGPVWGGLASHIVETPIPSDWVGFVNQARHQRSGGSSYLLGERRINGWWYYYLVALMVKLPLSIWLLLAVRAANGSRGVRDWILPTTIAVFLSAASIGSSRNYGIRYLLPLAPLAIVWSSALAARPGWTRILAIAGLFGQAAAVVSIHPHELTYFNAAAGGPIGGRRILADSNLDWSQGLRALARLQNARPELRDLTLYYFGDTAPAHYGVAGTCHVIEAGSKHLGLPREFAVATRFVAVSASLQWGPWGPDGYFRALDRAPPVAMTDDTSIAVYSAADLNSATLTVNDHDDGGRPR